MRSVRLLSSAVALALAVSAAPAQAQQFTTAAEVKPMLDITRANWVALREYNGQDQLLFTQILAWRCGLERISYAVNGGQKQRLETEACHEGAVRPNDIRSSSILPYVTFPQGSVKTVNVWIDYDDGSSDSADYARDKILSR